MFVKNSIKPIQKTLIVKIWEAIKEDWPAKHKCACKVINNCFFYNRYEAVKNLNTIAKIIAKVKSGFQLLKNVVFISFDCKYNEISLFD